MNIGSVGHLPSWSRAGAVRSTMNLDQKFDWKVQKLERACAQDPKDLELLLQLAEVYFQKGYYLGKGDPWFDLCIQRADQVLAIHRVETRAFTLKANALYGKGQWEEAERHYRAALQQEPKNALALVGMGNLEKRRRDYRMAREYFSRAVEIESRLWQAHYNMGKACMEEARSRDFYGTELLLDKAIYHMVCSLRLQPVETFIPNIYKALGELFVHTRRWSEAKKFFNRLTNHEKYAPIAYYYLGLTSFSLGKYKSAVQHYRSFLKYEPGSAVAWAKIGLSHLELGEYPKAREACGQAVALDPDNILALFTIGCSWLDEENLEVARTCFERVLQRAPEYFPAWVELVKTQWVLGHHDWLFLQLREEVRAFEATEGFDGGRGCYVGPRGNRLRRIDVLLTQLREMGVASFPVLMGLLREVQSDSLRFQIWEDLHDLSREIRVEEVVTQLRTPLRQSIPSLAEAVVDLSPYLTENQLMTAFQLDEDQLKRIALERSPRKDDIGHYVRTLEHLRSDFRTLQAAILRALAVKGTETAEHFLVGAMEQEARELKVSAAVALVYYGNQRALELLEQEAAQVQGPAQQVLVGLITRGWEKHRERHQMVKVEANTPDRTRGREGLTLLTRHQPPEVAKAAPSTSCGVCHRAGRDVERLLTGERQNLCTTCLSELWRDRDLLRNRADVDATCCLCGKGAFEIDVLYTRPQPPPNRSFHICSVCLDRGMGVLEQEEVDQFLSDFS